MLGLALLLSSVVMAQASPTTGAVKIDSDLSDEGVRSAKPVTTPDEVNPGIVGDRPVIVVTAD